MVRHVAPPGLTVSCLETGSFSLKLVLKACIPCHGWSPLESVFSIQPYLILERQLLLDVGVALDRLVETHLMPLGRHEVFQEHQRWGRQRLLCEGMEGKGPGADRFWKKENSLLTS